MRAALYSALAASGALATATPLLAGDRCADIAPPAATPAMVRRTATSRDLIELRDIGEMGTATDGRPLAVSPDSRMVAFQLRRADIASNNYCFGLFVVDLDKPGPARLVDHGGDVIMGRATRNGGVSPVGYGYPVVAEPVWSPDGRWIAYLRRDQGVTQAWRARADGSVAQAVTRSPIDVEEVRWSPDGRALVFSTRPGLAKAKAAIAAEAAFGYHYDDRANPDLGSAPVVSDQDAPHYETIDLETGALSPAGPDSALEEAGSHLPPSAKLSARSKTGRIAWTASADPNNVNAPALVWARNEAGELVRCTAPQCSGMISGLWWTGPGDQLLFARYEGWGFSELAIYRWRPGQGAPQQVLRTEQLLSGCEMADAGLLCVSEEALEPRHLVLIDMLHGTERPLFDPNPEWAAVRTGKVARLHWKNDIGLEVFGDLVLPPDHKAGERHPLIVVQYQSRGFLRGGTGDAYPIQLFAAAGYAVLSVQRPIGSADRLAARDYDEVWRRELGGAADARSVLSALELGVHLAIATGTIDPARIGLTGLSDGAAKARFALLHSPLFKAAAISSCCDDETARSLVGPAARRHFTQTGYPLISEHNPGFWADYSFIEDARRFDTPLLVQASDREYLSAVATEAALDEQHKPFDLFVFPNEYHVLWQPAHRAAMYQRDLDWFDFWLMGRTAPNLDARRAREIRHWEDLRTRWHSANDAGPVVTSSAAPTPPHP